MSDLFRSIFRWTIWQTVGRFMLILGSLSGSPPPTSPNPPPPPCYLVSSISSLEVYFALAGRFKTIYSSRNFEPYILKQKRLKYRAPVMLRLLRRYDITYMYLYRMGPNGGSVAMDSYVTSVQFRAFVKLTAKQSHSRICFFELI